MYIFWIDQRIFGLSPLVVFSEKLSIFLDTNNLLLGKVHASQQCLNLCFTPILESFFTTLVWQALLHFPRPKRDWKNDHVVNEGAMVASYYIPTKLTWNLNNGPPWRPERGDSFLEIMFRCHMWKKNRGVYTDHPTSPPTHVPLASWSPTRHQDLDLFCWPVLSSLHCIGRNLSNIIITWKWKAASPCQWNI